MIYLFLPKEQWVIVKDMGNTGYEIMSVERIINSTNQTYILSIRAPKQTQIKTDKHFVEEFSDFPELLGDVKMKRGKMYKNLLVRDLSN